MAGQHADIAFGARYDHHFDSLGYQQLLRRDEFELDLIGHGLCLALLSWVTRPTGRRAGKDQVQAASAAILRAFSTASSMVPTM